MALDTIRVFAISRLPWIKGQQRKVQAQEREAPRDYIDRESHYLWGKRYLLSVVERDAAPGIDRQHQRIVTRQRPADDDQARKVAEGAEHALCVELGARRASPSAAPRCRR